MAQRNRTIRTDNDRNHGVECDANARPTMGTGR